VLKSNQIILRAVELSDKDHIYRWENDTDYWPVSYTTKPFSSSTIEQYISNDAYDIYTTKQLRLMVEHIHDQQIIGCIDLFDFDPLHRRAGVGVLIDKAYRQMGFATKSIELLCQYGFNNLNLNQIYAHIDDHNHNSIKLFENCGFVKNAQLKNWNQHSGQFHDVFIFQKFNA
jgi:diamine N-acetyltransferase